VHDQRTEEDVASIVAPERPVLRISRALAVVPSLGPSKKVWRRLGFRLTDSFVFLGCPAFDLVLAGSGVRFLVPPRRPPTQQRFAEAISERLERGSGLLGWSWACQSVYRARSLLQRGAAAFETTSEGRQGLVVPREFTPGATTLLEPLVHEELPAHENGAVRLARILVTTAQPDAAAEVYEQVFGVAARRTTRGNRRIAEIRIGSVGAVTLDVMGPAEPDGTSRSRRYTP